MLLCLFASVKAWSEIEENGLFSGASEGNDQWRLSDGFH